MDKGEEVEVAIAATQTNGKDEDEPPLGADSTSLEARRRRQLEHAFLEVLTPEERDVIVRRFGLDGELLTLHATGKCTGHDVPRVKRIEASALDTLRIAFGLDAAKQGDVPLLSADG